MKALKLSILLGLMVFLAGCIPVSLHPLGTEKDVIYDPALVGKWRDGEEQLIIKKADDSGYLLVINTPKAPPEKFRAQLVRLGDFLFLDLSPEAQANENNVRWWFHLIAGHSFSKVKITKDTLQLTLLNEDWLEKKILAKEVPLAHEYIDDRLILTGSTEELQAFVKKYGADKEAFPTDEEASPSPWEWQRQK
jgi:hypothetical protein